uniref:transposase n=1 Tax=Peristeroidobacter agariperforans TaxID=268404 RepID=UPI00101C4B5C
MTANALVASVQGVKQFSTGRQLAAWLGLVPGSTLPAANPSGWDAASAETYTAARYWIHEARSPLPYNESKVESERWLKSLGHSIRPAPLARTSLRCQQELPKFTNSQLPYPWHAKVNELMPAEAIFESVSSSHCVVLKAAGCA